MIEHKFLKIKNLDEAARELDKLMLYEGFIVLCSVGRKNDTLLLRRIMEAPEQTSYVSPSSSKSSNKKKEAMFPNAMR